MLPNCDVDSVTWSRIHDVFAVVVAKTTTTAFIVATADTELEDLANPALAAG